MPRRNRRQQLPDDDNVQRELASQIASFAVHECVVYPIPEKLYPYAELMTTNNS
jgi:hypothetical protein